MNQKLLIILLLVFSLGRAGAQVSISYPVAAQQLTRGLDTSLLTVNLGFGGACTGVNVAVGLPSGVEYIPGSVVATGGSGGLTITYAGGTARRPQFTVSNAAVGNDITFTIKRIANCGAGSSGKDSIYVTGSCGSFTETVAAQNNYNILASALSVTPPTAITNASIGTSYTRNFTVTNGGNGCLDTLLLYIIRPSGSVGSPLIKLGAVIVPSYRTNADTSFYKVSGTSLPGSDKLMCNGESLVFTEEFTLINCLGLNTTYSAGWGRDKTALCQDAQTTGIINMSSGVPSVNYSFSAPAITGCATIPRTITMTVTNSGTGPATNLNIMIGNTFAGAFFNYAYFLDTTAFMVTLPASSAYHPAGIVANNLIAVANNAPGCAIGQVGMASFDLPAGFVLAAGQSLTVTFTVRTCSNPGCSSPGTYDPGNISARINYSNQCGTTFFTRPLESAAIVPGVFLGASYTVEAPAQVFAGNCFNYTINGSAAITPGAGFPNSYYEYKIILPAGVTLNTITELLHGDTPLPGYPVITAGVLTIRYHSTEQYHQHQIRLNFCVSAGTCGNISLATQITTTPDGTCATPIILDRCSTPGITAVCSIPCPSGGVTPQTWTFDRITFGTPDNNSDGIPDGSGTLDLSKIERTHYRPADVMRSYVSSVVSSNTIVPYATWPFVYAEWSFNAANWQPEGTATVIIKRGGTIIQTLTGITPSVLTANRAFKADWSSLLPGGFVYQSGDSVIVQADFKVLATPVTAANATSANPYGGNTKIEGQLTASMYASQTANPPSGNITGPNRFSCFVPLYNYFIVGSQQDISYNQMSGNGPSGCNDYTVGGTVLTYVRGSLSDRFFPYEYRPTHIPDSVIFNIPAGWNFVSHNSLSMNYNTNAGNFNTLVIPAVPVVTGTSVTGLTITYDLKSLIGTAAFPFVGTEGYQLYTTFKLKPTCSTPASAPTVMTQKAHYAYLPDAVNPNYYSISSANVLIYNTANRPSVAIQNNTGVVQGVVPQHYWDIQINNPSTQTAPFVWVSLEKGTGGISIDSVVLKPSNTVLTANAYGATDKWYQYSAAGIASGVNQQARIYFK